MTDRATCPHHVIISWEEHKRVGGSGTLTDPGTTVMFGGWKCGTCGEKFHPDSAWRDLLVQKAKLQEELYLIKKGI